MRGFILVCLAAAGVTQNAAAQTPDLPAALKPAGMSVYLEVPATGVQIYTCGKNDAGSWTWTFKAPEAALFDTAKKQIGKHYAGPSWEALSGGKVVGAVKASAPAPKAGAIPWLLLDIKSSEGSGVFNQAKGILRVSTEGGVAPGQGCDEANAGKEARVPYTATYLFLK
ncbi:MAG TPA: DUF3455 domain-containing protein [Xanthobacteraceae bacterium]|jgi:hypothetical protein|nr:DUF3455 domain-containing protein [Xanthobacteraceae bacterium]